MKEKDIKTKPAAAPKTVQNTPKMAVKSKEAVTNAVKDVKTAMKNNLVKQTMEKQLSEKAEQQQSERPENYAVDNIENAASSTADTAYHKGKTFVQNRIKARNHKEEIRKSEFPQTPAAEYPANAENISPKLIENQPKTAEHYRKSASAAPKNEKAIEQAKKGAQQKAAVKTKTEYLKSQSHVSADRPAYGVKTKENYIQEHTSQRPAVKDRKPTASGYATAPPDPSKSPKQAWREYVSGKLKIKAEYEKINAKKPQAEMPEKPEMLQATYRSDAPKAKAETAPTESAAVPSEKPEKPLVKTKESYMRSLRESKTEAVKSPYANSIKSKEPVQTASRRSHNAKKALKTRKSMVGKSKSIIKSGNAYIGSGAKRQAAKTAKTAKKAVKTQKEVTKKAAKEAAKRAKQAAQKSAQAAKAATKAAVRITVKAAQLVAAAVTKLVSALVAMGGWAVLLVILIVIIIIAAIAASPFGIFISEEAADPNSIPISSIVAECNIELSNQLDSIESGTAHDRVVMEGEQANWDEVIALFAVKVAGTEDETAQDVVVIDEAKKERLKQVFWDMHSLSSRTETVSGGEGAETVLYITIHTKTKDEMIAEYGFTENQQEALATLLENSDVLIASSQSLAISDGTAKGVLDALPENLSPKRKAVIKAACSLVGKVNYFWGGKSSAIGWDSEWGKLKLVTAEGSKSTGTKRPFGLDCSGFVTWAYINSGFSASQIGHGTKGQIAKCTRIPWESAQPGDLAFLSDLSHVGIVAGKDENGNILVIHCSSGANNVVITTNSIFGFAARPGCI